MKNLYASRLFRLSGLLLCVMVWLANSGNPPDGRTGSPFNGNCQDCHDTPPANYNGTVSIEVGGGVSQIQAGQTYPVIITLTPTAGSPVSGGYQLVVVDGTGTYANCGDLAAVNAQSGTNMAGGREYIEHRGDKLFSGGAASWNFNWTAPASVNGNTVNFYYIGNFTNNMNDDGGDKSVWTSTAIPFSGPPPVSVSASGTNVSCFGGNNGTATADPSGGTGTFTYLWNNNQTNQTATGLIAGTYTVTVTSGSTATATVVVSQPPALTAAASSSGPISCAQTSSTLTATAGGGTPGYSYAWSNGDAGNQTTVNTSGTYTVVVTDANNCTKTAAVTVTANITPPTANAGPNATLTCQITQVQLSGAGSSTGASFSYLWTTLDGNIAAGGTTLTPTVNACGTYNLLVTNNSNGCTSTDAVEVVCQIAPPGATAMGGSLDCSNPTTTLQGSSGTSGVTYKWAGPGINAGNQNQQNPSVAASGTYTLTVTNPANACTSTAQAVVTQNFVAPTAAATGGVLTCVNTSATLGASTNATAATFLWTGPGITSNANQQNPTVNVCGTYTVVVTNTANGCTNSATTTVTCNQVPPNVTASSATITCTTPAAQICASSTTGGVIFAWSGPNFSANTSCVTPTQPGLYTVVATNPANGCTSTASATLSIDTNVPFAQIATPANLNCVNASVQINANASSQGSNFTYAWSTSGGNILSGATTTTPTVNATGTYTITVTNTANGCTNWASTSVNASTAVNASTTNVSVACNGGSTGQALAIASGGNGTYTYLWSNSSTTSNISGLAAGTYTVTITDGETCSSTATAVISQPAALATNATATAQTAVGVNDGTATANPTGGTASYTYLWSNAATTQSISGLAPGSYSVVVTDNNGCTSMQTVTVNSFNCSLTANVAATNLSCNGAANGTATANTTGANLPVSYLWSNGATTQSVSGLAAGTITVSITDANGCPAVVSASLTEPPVLGANATATAVTAAGAADGTATTAPTGGTAPYTYLWSNNATTATVSGLAVGTYTVTVTDVNGCTAAQSATVNPFNCLLVLTTAATNVPCFGTATGTVSAAVSGATGAVSYLWNNGATTASILSVPAGTYTVVATDGAGCVATATVSVTQPQQLVLNASVTNAACANSSDGSALLTAIGGTAPFLFSNNFTNLPVGNYSATVTDANGCNATVNFSVASADTQAPVISCPATVSLCVSNTETYPVPTATDNCGPTNTPVLVSGVASGAAFPLGTTTQVFSVSDGSGNSATCSFNVVVSPLPEVAIVSVVNDQNGAGTGSIDITPSGTVPFTFVWTKDGVFFSDSEDLSGLSSGNYEVKVTDINGCVSTVGPIKIDNTIGTSSIDVTRALRLWPNPTATVLNIDWKGASPVAAQMMDTRGRMVMLLENTALQSPIAVESLPAGLYYLKASTEDGKTLVAKWVKE